MASDLDAARAALATVQLDRDVWRAQAEAAVRERDEARAEVATACAAMGHGSDDARWKPGETAVDALIRERDEARADADYHRSRAESWQATAQTHMEQRDEARAALSTLRDEEQAVSIDAADVYTALREQGIRGSWIVETRGDRIEVEPVPQLAPRESSPIVRAAAEALARAGYRVTRSRTRVHVWPEHASPVEDATNTGTNGDDK